jgi:hypothetical protein
VYFFRLPTANMDYQAGRPTRRPSSAYGGTAARGYTERRQARAIDATFSRPLGLALDADGNLLRLADMGNSAIRKIAHTDGTITDGVEAAPSWQPSNVEWSARTVRCTKPRTNNNWW